jgi:acetylglutamate kinase
VAINVSLLNALMSANYLPVISPVGYNSSSGVGGLLNVNGDDAAAAIAVGLGAKELLLIADVEGVRGENGEVVSSLNPESAAELIESGTAKGGMAAKLESALTAVGAGVARVRISDLAALSEEDRGTYITASQSVAL